MSDRPPAPATKPAVETLRNADRLQREAEALRANLKKRKDQQRARLPPDEKPA